jgi:cellulase
LIMHPISILTAVAAFASTVLAHGGVVSMTVGSTSYPGWQAFNSAAGQSSAERPYSSFNPILDPSDATMSCNDDGSSSAGQLDITLAAGATITGVYSQWTHAEGPYTVYLALCPGSSCTGTNSKTLKWFKIAQTGLISGTTAKGSWANGLLMANLKWSATIPSNLKAGAYLIRFETLALHQANTPQFYPECVQLIVTGGGSAYPTSDYLKSIPGAWGNNDPGVKIDIYGEAAKTQTTYLVPGPEIYPGFTGITITPNLTPPGSTGGPTTTPVTTPGNGGGPTTTTTTTTTPASGGATAAHYAQCGGQGYSGPTVCASPYTCKVSNAFYSQCL